MSLPNSAARAKPPWILHHLRLHLRHPRLLLTRKRKWKRTLWRVRRRAKRAIQRAPVPWDGSEPGARRRASAREEPDAGETKKRRQQPRRRRRHRSHDRHQGHQRSCTQLTTRALLHLLTHLHGLLPPPPLPPPPLPPPLARSVLLQGLLLLLPLAPLLPLFTRCRHRRLLHSRPQHPILRFRHRLLPRRALVLQHSKKRGWIGLVREKLSLSVDRVRRETTEEEATPLASSTRRCLTPSMPTCRG